MRARSAVLLALALSAAGGGAWAWRRRARPPAEAAAELVAVRRGAIESLVEATGSVVPLNRVEIRPPIGGRIERLLVSEGEAVSAGQIVAWMSSNDRAAILDAARAKGPAELARWEDSYKPTPIVSPLSGMVILRDVVQGQTVGASQTVYAVADALIVQAQVDESEIGKIRPGQRARVTLDAYPDRPAGGRVTDILYEGKNVSNVVTYGVKIRLDSVPPFFRSQMTASVSFVAERREGALLLPARAVRDGGGGRREVMVRGPEGRPTPKPVSVGLEAGEAVQVLSGLSEGDLVFAGAGARYRPQPPPASSPLSTLGGGKGPTQTGAAPRPRRAR